jgi:hypothetical protein
MNFSMATSWQQGVFDSAWPGRPVLVMEGENGVQISTLHQESLLFCALICAHGEDGSLSVIDFRPNLQILNDFNDFIQLGWTPQLPS